MKRTYPEDIEKIGDFYKEHLQEGSIEPSASLWANIESNLAAVPPQASPQLPPPAASNLLTFSALWKGALIIGALGSTIAVYVNNSNKGDKPVQGNEQSIESKSIIAADSTLETENMPIVTANDETKLVNEELKSDKNATYPADTLYRIEKEAPKIIGQDTSSVLVPVPVVVEEKKEEKSKPLEKESEKKPANFFERKLKQQKDTSSNLFKPNK